PWPEWGKPPKPLSARGLARLLAPFGVGSRNLRIGEQVVKGYAAGDLEDAFARYLAPESATALQAAPIAHETSFSDPLQGGACSGCENAVPTSVVGPGSGVADTGPKGVGAGSPEPQADLPRCRFC